MTGGLLMGDTTNIRVNFFFSPLTENMHVGIAFHFLTVLQNAFCI